jgi:HEAT repeat protein
MRIIAPAQLVSLFVLLMTCLASADTVQDRISELKSSDKSKRQSAIEALGKLGDARAVELLIGCLKDQDSVVRWKAAEALGRLEDARAVEPLIACLKDKDSEVRKNVTWALGELGDRRAVAPLCAALPDCAEYDVIVDALRRLDWEPRSNTERVYFWICTENTKELQAHWELTRRILLAHVKSGNARKIARAVDTFVSLDKPQIISELVRILAEQGNNEMAMAYWSSLHPKLQEVAGSWAKRHGLELPGILRSK